MWWRKIFTEPAAILVTVMVSAVTGLVIGVTQGFIQRKYGGWEGFFTAIATAVVVSILVGLTLQDYLHQEALRLALTGASAVIADDIWKGLRAIGRLVREDPLGAAARFLNALRGVKTSSNSNDKEG